MRSFSYKVLKLERLVETVLCSNSDKYFGRDVLYCVLLTCYGSLALVLYLYPDIRCTRGTVTTSVFGNKSVRYNVIIIDYH
jgi:hypothetical protein